MSNSDTLWTGVIFLGLLVGCVRLQAIPSVFPLRKWVDPYGNSCLSYTTLFAKRTGFENGKHQSRHGTTGLQYDLRNWTWDSNFQPKPEHDRSLHVVPLGAIDSPALDAYGDHKLVGFAGKGVWTDPEDIWKLVKSPKEAPTDLCAHAPGLYSICLTCDGLSLSDLADPEAWVDEGILERRGSGLYSIRPHVLALLAPSVAKDSMRLEAR